MNSLSKKMTGFGLSVALVASLFAGTAPAFAWDTGTEGNSQTENSTDYDGMTNGEIAIDGWIGTFDGTENPNRPDPPTTEWINVTVPARTLFGSLASDEGAVYSPQYRIYNNSARGVAVTPIGFAAVGEEPAALGGMELNLEFFSPSSLTIPLRSGSGEFLGGGLPESGQAILLSGVGESGDTAQFSIEGALGEGFTYPQDAPYQPSYALTLSFESLSLEIS